MKGMFTDEFISRLRRRALRRRIWYKALDRVERGILVLVSRVVDRVESEVLGVVLVEIVRKLRDAMKCEFVTLMETYGVKRVRDLVEYTLAWGNTSTICWANDQGYVRHVTNLKLNGEYLGACVS